MDQAQDDQTTSADNRSSPEQSGAFSTTHWSVVLSAGNGDQVGAAHALEQLCAKYWYPIYAFIRRRGLGCQDAEDLTQAFFEHLLEKEALKQVDRQKGRFRNFLLASLTNFLNNEWDKRRTFKRGGRHQIIAWDEAIAEMRYQCESVDLGTPEKLFERRWALTLLQQVLDQLKKEYMAADKAALFAKLEPFITGETTPGLHEQLAADLVMKEETVRVALSRLRRRFGELLRFEISHTVSHPTEVDLEIRDLFAAISRNE